MCGVAGVYRGGDDRLDAMVGALEHRGPDENGFFRDHGDDIAMGMRRLSIVDLEGGSQPIYNESGSVVVVFNGEIYNYPTLRAEMERKGHTFSTDTDTEILVHLWEEDGRDLVERLNGMFAFSLWDRDSEQLLLARDRLGIKPLYYATDGETFTWASEVASLLAAGVDRTLERQSVYNFLSLRYTPGPDTLFESIHKVPPGTTVLIDDGEQSWSQYWSPSPPTRRSPSPDQAADRVLELLEQSVQRRLLADVPIGVFLSGGLDSSAVAGLFSKHYEGTLNTFSVQFESMAHDESDEAQFVADHFGTDHREISVDLSSLDTFERVIRQYGEPLADPAILPTMLLSEFASETVKVVLTGEGADELFGGYWYYDSFPKHYDLFSRVPGPIANRYDLLGTLPGVEEKHLRYLEATRNERDAVLGVARRFTDPPDQAFSSPTDDCASALSDRLTEAAVTDTDGSLRSKLLSMDVRYPLTDGLLYKVDHATMAASLEARVPFLDSELVEYARSLPASMTVEGGQTKHVLRRAVGELLPDRTRTRAGHGFNLPVDEWLRSDHAVVQRYFDHDALAATPFVDPGSVRELLADHRRQRRNNQSLLWKILTYVAWYDLVVSN